MRKLWTSTDSKSDKIILIEADGIYKGNPKSLEINRFITRINNGEIPDELFCIPYSYIKKVENNPKKSEIRFYLHGKSEDELRINNSGNKRQVFDALKTHINHLQYEKKVPELSTYIRKPLIGIVVVTILLLVTLYFRFQLDHDVRYEVRGNPGILGVALGIASLGYTKISMIFGGLIAIAAMAIRKRMKERTEIEYLE